MWDCDVYMNHISGLAVYTGIDNRETVKYAVERLLGSRIFLNYSSCNS